MWQYKWESPNPEKWSSDFSFASYQEAKDSAISHALLKLGGKRRRVETPDKRQLIAIWRSLRRAGWRIRKKKT